jgi:hypothetical protein
MSSKKVEDAVHARLVSALAVCDAAFGSRPFGMDVVLGVYHALVDEEDYQAVEDSLPPIKGRPD